MKRILLLIIGILVFASCNSVDSDTKIPIIVDYKYYSSGSHSSLTIAQNNEILYILEERDYDTLYVEEDWIIFTWEQSTKQKEEVFPKEWRKYKVYNTRFVEVD
jgi:hypothetical protein